MDRIEYNVVIQRNEEKTGYWAYCPDLPGCNAIGDTLREVKHNIKEAITGYIETLELQKKKIPKPLKNNLIIEKIPIKI